MKHHPRQRESTVEVKCYHCDGGYVFDGVSYRPCPECGGMGKVTMDTETGLLLRETTNLKG